MTREEAIEYWEQFNAEIDDLYDACSDADRDVLVKQREIVEYTISALRKQEQQPNAPLTLDELRKMDGEPVYIPKGECWARVSTANDFTVFVWPDKSSCSAADWYNQGCGQAFRQKPEEGTV